MMEKSFKVTASTTSDCQRLFAIAKKTQKFAFDENIFEDSLPKWIKEKEDEADKDLDLQEKNEFENKQEL